MTYQVDVTKPILDIDDQPQSLGDKGDLQLRHVIETCCGNDPRGELSGEDKVKAWEIARRAHKNDVVEMTDKDFVLLKARSGSLLDVCAHSRVVEIIDYYLARGDAPKAEAEPETPKADTNGSGEVDLAALAGAES